MGRVYKLIGFGAIVVSCCAPGTAVCQPHQRAPLTADQRTVIAGHNAFAIDLFHALRTNRPGSNLLVSPFSVSTALAMTYAGARNNTAAQMADVLHFNLPND